ncbi:3-dehydroquinate synthase [Peptococcus simiae]|uniref:3-dehydroquinate synthase n=1 Tax=Peptococcus simiae TaxID=1643805 RepID=A0ABW9GYI9_9FIRM
MAGLSEKRVLPVGTDPSYEVNLGLALADLPAAISGLVAPPRQVRLVSDERVFALYGGDLVAGLRAAGYQVATDLVPPGEKSKTIPVWTDLMNRWAAEKVHRDDLVLALGGGVIGDLAGFAAASYVRGIRMVQVPTTLLAALDASVGGKTALNLPAGKNLVGAFKQPLAVFCPTETLASLSQTDWQNGLAELVKTAVLTDPALFDRLEAGPLTGTSPDLTAVLARAVGHKIRYVEADPCERGIRAHLNLGHTLAHAIEQASGHAIAHGHAVAIGLAFISRVAVNLGRLSPEDGDRIIRVLTAHGLPVTTGYDRATLLEAIQRDKKATAGGVRWILPVAIGSCIDYPVSYTDLPGFLEKGGLS